MQPTLPWRALQNDAASNPPTQAAPANTDTGTTAPATETPAPSSPFGGLTTFLPLIAIFAVFYFVLIGPERKARKKREAMLKQVGKGDRVLTTGGMFATVAAIQEDEVTLQIADNVRARFTRAAIQSVVESDKPAEAKKS